MNHSSRLFFCLLCLVLCIESPAVWSLSQPGDDKVTHAGASFALSTISYVTMRRSRWTKWESLMGALAITTTVGVAKEITDPELSTNDLAADALGAGASFVLCFTIDW